MSIGFIKKNNSVIIVVSNSFSGDIPPIHKLYKLGFSTKGENRGLGLSNLREIMSKYNNVSIDTRIEGKTTLANIITGKMKKYDGTVKKFCNNYIGYIGDKFNFYSFKTGMNNLKYIASSHNLSINQVMDIIRFLNIKIDLNEKVKNYSLAMKRKLALIAELEKMCYKIIILQNGRIQDSIDVNNISSSINKNIFSEL